MCSKLWTGKVRNKETTSNLHLGMLDGIYNPRWLLSTGDEDAWHFVLDSRAARVNQRWGRLMPCACLTEVRRLSSAALAEPWL